MFALLTDVALVILLLLSIPTALLLLTCAAWWLAEHFGLAGLFALALALLITHFLMTAREAGE